MGFVSCHFLVEGQMHPSVSVVSWMGGVNEFEAGTKATLLILPKDAFGNNVSSTSKEPNSFNFIVSVCQANGSFINMPNVTNVGWNEAGYIVLEFIASIAGDLSLRIAGGNQTLNGSPLPFKVNPGDFLSLLILAHLMLMGSDLLLCLNIICVTKCWINVCQEHWTFPVVRPN